MGVTFCIIIHVPERHYYLLYHTQLVATFIKKSSRTPYSHSTVFPSQPQVREALKHNFPAFDVVEFLGTGPIRSQLETFATASVVVAPHGAGLSNIIVSRLHTPILEIGPITCPPCFLNLAVKVRVCAGRDSGGTSSRVIRRTTLMTGIAKNVPRRDFIFSLSSC